jgi:hypothetical protein
MQGDRINGRRFQLTYSSLYSGEFSHDDGRDVRDSFAMGGGILEFNHGIELHQNPAHAERKEHVHVYLYFAQRIDITNRRTTKKFDVAGTGERVLHPEVSSR